MKNLMKFAAMFFAAVTLVACFPNGTEPEPTPEEKDVTFEVAITSVGEDVATVSVSHNGAETDTWYGFVTTDTKRADLSLIYEKVEEISTSDLTTGITKTVELTGLTRGTSYKYVVFGMGADGAIYGTVGSAIFETESGRSVSLNPNWKIEFIGDYTANNETYTNCVSIESSDEETYYIDLCLVDEWNAIAADIYSYAEKLVAAMKNAANQNGVGLDYFLSQGSGIIPFGDQYPGTYVAYMLGVNAQGEITRLYAVSEEFEIAEAAATPEYEAWLGYYNVAGTGSVYDENLKQYVEGDVEFGLYVDKLMNNDSYVISGWTNQTALPFGAAYWLEEDAIVFSADVVAEGVDFGGEYGVGDIYLIGITAEGGLYIGADVAYALNGEQGKFINGFTYEQEGITFVAMSYFVEFVNEPGSVYELSEFTPYFPLTMTPATAPAGAPAKAMSDVKSMKFDKSEAKTYKTLNKTTTYQVGGRKFNF